MSFADEEIDLHTCRPENVRWELLPFLDRGYSEGWNRVRIIHGIGEGVLRSRVWSLLEDLPYVSQYRLARYSEGGRGVTVVEFVQDRDLGS